MKLYRFNYIFSINIFTPFGYYFKGNVTQSYFVNDKVIGYQKWCRDKHFYI